MAIMIRFARETSFSSVYIVVLLALSHLVFPTTPSIAREDIPFRYEPAGSENYGEIAEKFSLDPKTIEDLNPTLWSRPSKILLVERPRDAEEAMLLLEEAKRVEVLGGVGARKAERLYRGILVAAGLIPSESGNPKLVEMSSDTVAQALLAWGKIHESSDTNQSDWAYRQVQMYFPDKTAYYSKAVDRLNRMETDPESFVYPPPPSALEGFPFSPHLLIDIDANRLASQLRNLNLPETFAELSEHPNERVRRRHDRSVERFEETLSILSHLRSVHIGGWVDPDLYSSNPETGFKESVWVIVGRLESTFDEFASSVGLSDMDRKIGEYEIYPLGDEALLATDRQSLIVAKNEILEELIESGPPFHHPNLASPDSAYQRARAETGSGVSIFGYFDLEGFLQGPGLAFAREGEVEGEDAIFLSLLLSAAVGVNGIQGLALGLDYDRDALTARADLCHENDGILALFSGAPCAGTTLRFFPLETHGFLQVLRPCTPAVEELLAFDIDSVLGIAGPVYRAHYERLVDRFEAEKGVRFDPLALFRSGMASEISVGVQLPGGMVPIPNLLVSAPTTLASREFQNLEAFFTREENVEFVEERLAGQWYRHAVVPIESPLFLDLSYTVYDGCFFLTNNSDLIAQAIEKEPERPGFGSTTDFKEFSEEWFPSNHLTLYVSKDLSQRLARLSRALLSGNLEDPLKGPFARIFQSQMDEVIGNSQYSGLGVRLGEDGIKGNLQIRSFRHWFSALLSLRWMRLVEEWDRENSS